MSWGEGYGAMRCPRMCLVGFSHILIVKWKWLWFFHPPTGFAAPLALFAFLEAQTKAQESGRKEIAIYLLLTLWKHQVVAGCVGVESAFLLWPRLSDCPTELPSNPFIWPLSMSQTQGFSQLTSYWFYLGGIFRIFAGVSLGFPYGTLVTAVPA